MNRLTQFRLWRLFSHGGTTTLSDGSVTATINGVDPKEVVQIQAAMQPQPEGRTLIIRNYSLGPGQGPNREYAYLAIPITPTMVETLKAHALAAKDWASYEPPSGIRPWGNHYLRALRGQGFYFNDAFAREQAIPTADLLDERRIIGDDEHYRWIIHNADISGLWSAPGANYTDSLDLLMFWSGGVHPHFRIMGRGDDKYQDHVSEMVYIDLLEDALDEDLGSGTFLSS